MADLFIALGTNLGERAKNLGAARQLLGKQIKINRVSPVYETEPWGYADQPRFLNQVIGGETPLTPQDLLFYLKGIESQVGRQPTFRFGPRVIDLDILFYDNLILNTPTLILPHPRLTERMFVLAPLADIAPKFIHPVEKKTVRALLNLLNQPLPKRYNMGIEKN